MNLFFLTRQGSVIDLLMNYAAFAGVSEIDNLYAEAQRNMKVQEAVPVDGVDNPELEKCLTYKKQSKMTKEDKEKANDHDHQWLMIVVNMFYYLTKVIYKVIYFYLFPYLVVILSHSLCWKTGCPPQDD